MVNEQQQEEEPAYLKQQLPNAVKPDAKQQNEENVDDFGLPKAQKKVQIPN